MRFHQIVGVSPIIILRLVSATRSNSVPHNLRDFYNGLVRNKTCHDKLEKGFYSTSEGENNFAYCGDHLDDYRVVYISGSGGNFADMDVDCDGEIQNTPENDGRCGRKYAPDRSDETAFRDIIEDYDVGIGDLDPSIHTYAVFGNDGRKHKGPSFNPLDYDIHPLSVIAVVCNEKMFYGVWGDIYGGGRRDKSMVGEVSLAMATAFFGRKMNGNNGYEKNSCLYIAFTGKEAVPGKYGAEWGAKTWVDFHESIAPLGDHLIQRIPATSNWSRPLRMMRADD